MILYNHDPAMRYEDLARAAFNNCKKYGDPFGYAAQERYNNFVPKPNIIGKRTLSTVFIKLILDNLNSPYINDLKKLEDLVWESETQSEVIDIIDKGIEIVNKIED